MAETAKSLKFKLDTVAERLNVHMEEKQNSHFYTCTANKRLWPSATTILKAVDKSAALQNWRNKIIVETFDQCLELGDEPKASLLKAMAEPQAIADAAADRGHVVHYMIEQWINEGITPPDIEPDGIEYEHFDAAREFLSSQQLIPVKAEYMVLAFSHLDNPGFGGMIDCIALDPKGRVCIVDWKTGHLYDSHLWQLEAYRYALKYMADIDVSSCAVYSTKDKQVKFSTAEDFIKFVGIAHAWDVTHKRNADIFLPQ